MIIHQVYGLFRDDKPMNKLFLRSNKMWEKYAQENGYTYKLWCADECDELVNTYSDIKKYYHSVRHNIMKCDIIRYLILYQFGGMYVDLDVMPNKNVIKIDPEKFTLCNYVNKNTDFDIEIIVSQKYNIDLYNFLLYIPKQIEEKNNIDIYTNWKVRYVFQTTGPRSFIRFCKENDIKYDTIPTYHLSEDERLDEIDLEKYAQYDCLSYYSLSYMVGKPMRPYQNKEGDRAKSFKNLITYK